MYVIALIVVIVRFLVPELGQIEVFEGIKSLAKLIASGGEGSLELIVPILWLLALAASPVLSLVAWLKDKKIPAYIAAVLYLLSLNLISTLLCLIGARPRFLEGKKTLLFIAGYIGIVILAFWVLMCTPLSDPMDSKTMFVVFALISFLALILNFAGWLKNNGKVTLIAAIAYILSVTGIPSAVLCFIGRAQLKKRSDKCNGEQPQSP